MGIDLPTIEVHYGDVDPLDVARAILEASLERRSIPRGTFHEYLAMKMGSAGEYEANTLVVVSALLDAVTATFPGGYKTFADTEGRLKPYTINVPEALARAVLYAIRAAQHVPSRIAAGRVV
jgi:hypothetical protein